MPLPEYASCCVLSYNRGTFLYRSVKSLLENADYPLELIIHDDGSTDAMVEDTLRWAREEGAMVIRNPPGWNEGQGVALNRMFRMATGWPRFKLDQDLEYKPGWLRSAVDLMHCTPEIGLLGLFKYNHDPVDHTKTILEDWGDHEEHTREWC